MQAQSSSSLRIGYRPDRGLPRAYELYARLRPFRKPQTIDHRINGHHTEFEGHGEAASSKLLVYITSELRASAYYVRGPRERGVLFQLLAKSVPGFKRTK